MEYNINEANRSKRIFPEPPLEKCNMIFWCLKESGSLDCRIVGKVLLKISLHSLEFQVYQTRRKLHAVDVLR